MGLQLKRRAGRRTMNRQTYLCVALVLAALGVQSAAAQTPAQNAAGSPNERAIRARTQQIAVEALGLKLDKVLAAGHQDNFSGLRTDDVTFSQRLDSRTFFAYDKRFSNTKETGLFKEPDGALVKRSRELLERLQIPAAEIGSIKVVQEKTRVGQHDAKTGRMKLGPIEPGKKWARIERRVEGLPVFSSRGIIGLKPNGAVGYLEVHWPEIPAKVTETARHYREIVRGRWRAPALPGARVESVTPGILHSPAAGTAMDIVPVIRVIYAPLDKRMGKKPVEYVDENGKPVPMPRVFLNPPREALKGTRTPPAR